MAAKRKSRFTRKNSGTFALHAAYELNGKPYIFGGEWPKSGGTDCSGLVQFAYSKVGIELPRTTYEQYKLYRIGPNVKSKPGDLLFIAGADPLGTEPGHVMMFVAPGVIHGKVFEAEMTGTKIGLYPYDTEVYEYRTRPALFYPNLLGRLL